MKDVDGNRCTLGVNTTGYRIFVKITLFIILIILIGAVLNTREYNIFVKKTLFIIVIILIITVIGAVLLQQMPSPVPLWQPWRRAVRLRFLKLLFQIQIQIQKQLQLQIQI